MKIQVNEDNQIEITECYSGIMLRSDDGETIGICNRDTGFEFNYMGTWYSAKQGKVEKLRQEDETGK